MLFSNHEQERFIWSLSSWVPLSPALRDALVARMQDRSPWEVDPASVLPLVNVVQR